VEELREKLAARRAIDLIAAQATPIPVERVRAREKLWTPEDGGEEAVPVASRGGAAAPGGGLWTPGR